MATLIKALCVSASVRTVTRATLLVAAAFGSAVVPEALAASAEPATKAATALPNDYQVIELRRYALVPNERANFARYFEAWFPEAFQQLGAITFGEFFDRRDADTFTWLRGFHDMDERARANQAFYYGPVWKEHKAPLNDRLIDHTNTLLLKPLDSAHRIAVLPSLDPVMETKGASGIVVAQVMRAAPGRIDELAASAPVAFEGYRASGVREAGVLVTLDAPNNFPALPFRTDGPYLIWLGIVRDARMLEALQPLLSAGAARFAAAGLVQGEPELMVLDPAPRSRLRWVQ